MTRHDASRAGLAVPTREPEVPISELEDIEIRKSIANFRGSFVGEHNLVPPAISGEPLRRKSTFRDRITPLAGGWRDVGIWKSAVSRGDSPPPPSLKLGNQLKAFSLWR